MAPMALKNNRAYARISLTDIDVDDDDDAIMGTIIYATAYAVAAANNRCGPRGKPVFERCLQLFLNV